MALLPLFLTGMHLWNREFEISIPIVALTCVNPWRSTFLGDRQLEVSAKQGLNFSMDTQVELASVIT